MPILFRHNVLWQTVFCGFLLFRIIDIIKQRPARQIDKYMGGSWGILLDDIVSGCYAVAILYLMKTVSYFISI